MSMEKYLFKITRARAEMIDSIISDRVKVTLWYPNNPKIEKVKLPGNLEYGIEKFSELMDKGYAEIADENHPIRPPSAGGVYVFSDGVISFHRRDMEAYLHPLQHSIPAGYPQTEKEVSSEEGIKKARDREVSEETLLFTKDGALLVPKGCEEFVLKTMENLGIYKQNYKIIPTDIEIDEGRDILEIRDEDDNIIFQTKTNLAFGWTGSTTMNALWVLRVPYTSDEIIPVDTEGMFEDGKYKHFERETYKVSLEELNKKWGSKLVMPDVYKAKIENGKVSIYTPEYKPPFYSPSLLGEVDLEQKITEDKYPHIFWPDELLRKMLTVLEVDHYFRWMDIELEYAIDVKTVWDYERREKNEL